MRTLFIADLHLNSQEPAVTAGFLRFLREETQDIDALYILGDFFEAWIGDDDPEPLHQSMAEALRQLHERGVPCYFIHGNRDFLLGSQFASRSGLTLLPQEVVLDLYGKKTVLLHGDQLCTDDHAYQRFRRWVHRHWIQRLFLWLPLRLRLKIAASLRRQSRSANQYKTDALMDVNATAVELMLSKHTAEQMIHGHTHRPALHFITLHHGESALRAVLGAWHEVGWVLEASEQGLQLRDFPLLNSAMAPHCENGTPSL